MSDIEEPPTKMSKYEELQYLEDMDEGLEEGQEEWLSEGVLTDDDYHITEEEHDKTDSNFGNTSHEDTMLSMKESESVDQTNNTSNDNTDLNIEDTLNNLDGKTGLSGDLDKFIDRNNDDKPSSETIMKTPKEERVKDEADGNDTDDLLRLLEDDQQIKKKTTKTKKTVAKTEENESSDDDEFIYDRNKVKTLKVAKNALMKKVPTKAVPEESETEYESSADEGVTMKAMFGMKKQPEQPKTDEKENPKVVKHITHVTSSHYKDKPKPTIQKQILKQTPSKSKPENRSFKNIEVKTAVPIKTPEKSVAKGQKTVKFETKNVAKENKFKKEELDEMIDEEEFLEEDNFEMDEEQSTDDGVTMKAMFGMKNQLDQPKPEEKVVKHIVHVDSSYNKDKPTVQKKTLKQTPSKSKPRNRPFKNIEIKTPAPITAPEKSVAKGQKTVKFETNNVANEKKDILEELDEIIDEEEFFEDDNFDLDEEEFEGELEADESRGQRIMRPEMMDEEVPSDQDSHSEDGSLYDELPSSDSEDFDDWFTLDIRSERASDYLPLLGSRAHLLLAAERRRCESRVATLRQSLSALTDSARRQADSLRNAAIALAELDDTLRAA